MINKLAGKKKNPDLVELMILLWETDQKNKNKSNTIINKLYSIMCKHNTQYDNYGAIK